jgi:hypothetical protein
VNNNKQQQTTTTTTGVLMSLQLSLFAAARWFLLAAST